MTQRIVARWSFIVAGIVFLVVAVAPLVRGGALKPVFFVLAMVFLVLGAAMARRRKSGPPPAA
jgi:succinate-acetate transporter protein